MRRVTVIARRSRFATVDACHRPPRAVRMPRAFQYVGNLGKLARRTRTLHRGSARGAKRTGARRLSIRQSHVRKLGYGHGLTVRPGSSFTSFVPQVRSNCACVMFALLRSAPLRTAPRSLVSKVVDLGSCAAKSAPLR